jgi:hypothetical protein
LEGSEEHDTDERFEDHPELAPHEGRYSVERVKSMREEIRKRSQSGDGVDEAGDDRRKRELDFSRNQDFAGDERSLSTDADFTRGSGYSGSMLAGEGRSGEDRPANDRPEGFDPSVDQQRNIEAIRREEEGKVEDWSARPPLADRDEDQGRDVGHPAQAAGPQRFGRDLGSSGLDQMEREGRGVVEGRATTREQKVWASVLRRLGGGSPGSAENLQLMEKFSRVQFPATRETVIDKLEPGAEFRLKEGIVVDLKSAVERSRNKVFRNPNELVDCVKDELRRQEAAGVRLLKPA